MSRYADDYERQFYEDRDDERDEVERLADRRADHAPPELARECAERGHPLHGSACPCGVNHL